MITPKKIQWYKALLCLATGIIGPIFIIVQMRGDRLGWIGGGIMSAVFLLAAAYYWYSQKKTPDEEEEEEVDINDESPEVQVKASKKAIWVFAAVGLVLSFVTYYELSALEDGTRHSVRLWAPVAMLYNLMGFWPAVLCWPVLCGVGIRLALRRIKQARAMEVSAEA